MFSPTGHPRWRWVSFFINTDLEKCSIASLTHQWIICSEWVPSEWAQTADKNITIIHTTPVHQLLSFEVKSFIKTFELLSRRLTRFFMEARFRHWIKNWKGNCNFLSHNSHFFLRMTRLYLAILTFIPTILTFFPHGSDFFSENISVFPSPSKLDFHSQLRVYITQFWHNSDFFHK